MTDYIKTERKGRVLTIALNRPDKMNALTHDMYAAMADGLDRATEDSGIRAVMFHAHGDVFTAGNDLKDFAAGMPEGTPPVVRFLETLRDFEKPVLAAVGGPAIGVGVTMLLHCDLSFAGEAATFRAPFAHIGLVPEAGSSLLMPQAMGTAFANDMLLAGRTLTAPEALQAGLVSRVFTTEDLIEKTLAVATDISRQAPTAMKHSKALIRTGREAVAQQMKRESVHFNAQLRSDEFAEAMAATMEKRAPAFA
ncbi:MAG: enoyl-CoA hydratase-related protein [Pseudomonadota bacterium]